MATTLTHTSIPVLNINIRTSLQQCSGEIQLHGDPDGRHMQCTKSNNILCIQRRTKGYETFQDSQVIEWRTAGSDADTLRSEHRKREIRDLEGCLMSTKIGCLP